MSSDWDSEDIGCAAVLIVLIICATFLIHTCMKYDIQLDVPEQAQTQEPE